MNRHQRYRLVVLDVDGTIAKNRASISPRMVSAIAATRQAGATVCLATGRMRRSAVKFAEMSGADGPIICSQGALITSPGGLRTIRKVVLGRSEVVDSLAVMRSAGVHINLYIDDDIYVERTSDWAEAYSDRMEVTLREVRSLDSMAGSGPLAILGVLEPDATHLAERLHQVLGERATVTHSLMHFCEVGSREAGKGVALAYLAGELGVDRQGVIAFGDGQGDEGMLQWAGLGVAVGSAHPDVLSAADVSIAGPEAEGPAVFIEKLLDMGRIGS